MKNNVTKQQVINDNPDLIATLTNLKKGQCLKLVQPPRFRKGNNRLLWQLETLRVHLMAIKKVFRVQYIRNANRITHVQINCYA